MGLFCLQESANHVFLVMEVSFNVITCLFVKPGLVQATEFSLDSFAAQQLCRNGAVWALYYWPESQAPLYNTVSSPRHNGEKPLKVFKCGIKFFIFQVNRGGIYLLFAKNQTNFMFLFCTNNIFCLCYSTAMVVTWLTTSLVSSSRHQVQCIV